MTNDDVADVFISYRHREPTQTWVRTQLGPALAADGLACVIDVDDFTPGSNLLEEIERGSRSLVTVAVVDALYRDSDFTRLESEAADTLIVVVRGDVPDDRIPPAQVRIDLGDSDDTTAVVTAVNDVLTRVFILEARQDEEWVTGLLLPELARAGVSAEHASELSGSVSIRALEEAVRRADKVVVVLSDAFYEEANERNSVIARSGVVVDSVETQDKVVPVKRDEIAEIEPRYTRRIIIDATESDFWDRAIADIFRAIDVDPPGPPELPPSPYPGMRAFEQDGAEFFFGRSAEIGHVIEKLRRNRFATVVGPSGSGKSSLVKAGVIPEVERTGLGDGTAFRTRVMRPTTKPVDALARAIDDLARPAGPTTGKLLVIDQFEEVFADDVERLEEYFADLQAMVSDDPELHVILTVRADFTAELMTSPIWPTLIVPSRVEVLPLRGPALRDAIREPARKRRVVVEAALVERLVADTEDQPGLMPFLQQTLRRMWGNLRRPFLSLDAYIQLGTSGSGIRQAISDEAEEAMNVIIALVPGGELIARRMLLRLIHFGRGTPDTRRQVPESDLALVTTDTDGFAQVLAELRSRRIVTVDTVVRSDGSTGEANGHQAPRAEIRVVDLAHDAIITGWPKLEAWIAEDRALEVDGREWGRRARSWQRDKASYLTSKDLTAAERWLEAAQQALIADDLTSRYIEQSAARERRSRRWRVAGYATFLFLAVGAAVVTTLLYRSANEARRDAEREADQRVATQMRTAAAAYTGGLSLQALLTRAADIIDPTELSAIEMLATVERDPPIGLRIDATRRNVGFESAALLDDGRFVVGDGIGELSVWSPDGTFMESIDVGYTVLSLEPRAGSTLVAAGGGTVSSVGNVFSGTDGRLGLIDVDGGRNTVTNVALPTEHPVSTLLFDGDALVAGTWGGEVFVVDIADPAEPVVIGPLPTPTAPPRADGACEIDAADRKIRSLASDDRSRWLAAGANDCVIHVWDRATLVSEATLTEHTSKVRSIVFVPGSSELLSTGDDRSIRSTDLADRDPTSVVLIDSAGGPVGATGSANEGRVIAMCVSPDGSRVVTAGRDHVVRHWIRTEEGTIDPNADALIAHDTTVRSVTCLSAERFISVAGDGLILWDRAQQNRWGSSTADHTDVVDVAVRPGSTGETAVADGGSLRILGRAEPSPMPPDVDELDARLVGYSPDGRWLVVAGDRASGFADRVVVIDADSFMTIGVHDATGVGDLWSVSVGNDGTVVAGMNDGEILIAAEAEPVSRPVPSGRRVTAIAIFDDGHLVAGDSGGTLFCGTGEGALESIELGRGINDLAVDHISGTVVAGTADGLIQVFPDVLTQQRPDDCDPADWTRTAPPVGHDSVESVDLASDGELVVAANSDGTAEIWDIPRLRLLGTFSLPAGNRVKHASIDPAARVMVIGGDATVVAFDVDRDGLRDRLCDIAARDLTGDEQEAFVPDDRYRELAQCPA